MITQKVFMQMKDPKHPLHDLIPPIKVSHSQMVLRPTYQYQLPLSKTARYKRDLVPFCISKKFKVRLVVLFYCSIVLFLFMVVVMYLIFIVSLCHFNCFVAFIKSYLILLCHQRRHTVT